MLRVHRERTLKAAALSHKARRQLHDVCPGRVPICDASLENDGEW